MTEKKIPSIAELREIAQGAKSGRTDWQYRIHRAISIHITRMLLYTPAGPDFATFAAFFFGALGAATLVGCPGPWGITGFLFFYFYFLLDKVDGELARYYDVCSVRGIHLDYIGHLTFPPLVLLSFGVRVATETGSSLYSMLGGLAAIACVFSRLGPYLPAMAILGKAAKEPELFPAPEESNEPASPRGDSRPGFLLDLMASLTVSGRYWIVVLLFAILQGVRVGRPELSILRDGFFVLVCLLELARAGGMARGLAKRADRKSQSELKRMKDLFRDDANRS